MFCSQCATQLTQDDVYCPTCAKPVASFAFSTANVAQVEPLETPTVVRVDRVTAKPLPSSRWLYATLGGVSLFGLILVIGLAGLAGIYIAFFQPTNSASFDQQREPARNTSLPPKATPRPTIEPTPPPVKTLILDQMITVPAGQFKWFSVNAPTAGTIKGGFVTYDGGKDIDAFVVDSANFPLVEAGSPFRSLYQGVRAERGKIDIPIAAGTYYIVFSNKHALLTGKRVAAEIYFEN